MDSIANPNGDIAKTLLQAKANPLAVSSSGQTTLMFVDKNTNVAVVDALLTASVPVNAVDQDGGTALFYAVLRASDSSIVKALIKAGAAVNSGSHTEDGATGYDYYGVTPLMIAASHLNTEVISILLEAGANVNATDSSGATPLMYAAKNVKNDPTPIKALMNAGANLTMKDQYSKTACDYEEGSISIFELLRGTFDSSGDQMCPQ